METLWLKKYPVTGDFVSRDKLMGWFQDGKEVPSGALWTHGTIHCVLSLKTGSQEILVRAVSSLAGGAPSFMSVYLDGNPLGGVYVEELKSREYSFPLPKKHGEQGLLSVSFLNDYRDATSGEDRNLKIESIRAI